MMSKLNTSVFLVVATLVFAACSKKTEDAAGASDTTEAATDSSASASTAATPAAAPAGAERLPGENTVRESLAKKDYDTAVGGLLALRGAATGDRYTAYMELYGEVLGALRENSATDRKAAEALVTLQAASRGR